VAEDSPGQWYCVDCGVRLQPGHAFCWNCGAGRWHPPPEGPPGAPPPAPEPVQAEPPAPTSPSTRPAPIAAAARLGTLQFYFAFWAVALLVWATVDVAVLAAPAVSPGLPVTTQLVVIVIKVLLAAVHGVAYYGIRARRVTGWLTGVVLAGLWSLVLIGIPALFILLQRSTREAFGLA